MTHTREILAASPRDIEVDLASLAAAIDACLECVQTCASCADADLFEQDVEEMRACIATCVNCGDVCAVTARVLSRPAQWDGLVVVRLLQACVRTCTSCAEECARHAHHHRHCAICEQTCRECVQACTTLLEQEALRDP
jgi:hypothetical protein